MAEWKTQSEVLDFTVLILKAVENLNALKIPWHYVCHIKGKLLKKT